MNTRSQSYRTEISIPVFKKQWTHSDQFVSLGSCFSEEIGKRLESALFTVRSNPFGTLFNPLAIARCIDRALAQREFKEDDLFEHEELWRHFDIHSRFASMDKVESLDTANRINAALGIDLRETDVLIVTLGTAWSYRHRESDLDVGHNHRLPLDQFEKRLLKTDEIVSSLAHSFETLQSLNPSIHIIVTVSPVRHTRDGLWGNNLSKSVLHLATNEITKAFSYIDYFPAYEILIDDLRDYRFYAEDMIHPNNVALQHIWDRFAQSCLTSQTVDLCTKIQAVRASLEHRPRHRNTRSYQRFLDAIRCQIEAIKGDGIDANPLIEKLQNRQPTR